MQNVDQRKGTVIYRLVWVNKLTFNLNRYSVLNRKSHMGYLSNSAKIQLMDSQEIKFAKTTREEIVEKRLNKEIGVVMVVDGETYFANIHEKARLETLLEAKLHKCGCCKRLSAKTDECGGCAKVRDYPIEEYETVTSIQNKMRIEKYPFITEGLDAMNTTHRETLILECEHFEKFMETK